MVVAVVIVFALWWVLFRSFVTTNDSRIATDLIRVAPAEIGGTIEKVAVQEGDYVKAGQVLVEIDHRIAEANYEKAKAKFELADWSSTGLRAFTARTSVPNGTWTTPT